MKTREQEYAATIYTQVEGVKGKSYQSDYKNAAKNLPVLIRSAGLVQALYFTQTRNPGSEALIKHLANVIEKPHETLSDNELRALVVHPPNSHNFWEQTDASLSSGLMASAASPDKWMTMCIPILCCCLDRFNYFLPSLKSPPFER